MLNRILDEIRWQRGVWEKYLHPESVVSMCRKMAGPEVVSSRWNAPVSTLGMRVLTKRDHAWKLSGAMLTGLSTGLMFIVIGLWIA